MVAWLLQRAWVDKKLSILKISQLPPYFSSGLSRGLEVEIQFPLWVASKEKAGTVFRSLYYIWEYQRLEETRTYSIAAA